MLIRFLKTIFNVSIVLYFASPAFSQTVTADCSDGAITEKCLCHEAEYNTGFCCNDIWFDPGYADCPRGNYYFVDPNNIEAGDDNPGTEALPWEDPSEGAKKLFPGDVLLIKEGTYSKFTGIGHRGEPGIYAIRSGTADDPIIIRSYPDHDVQLIGGIEGGNPTLLTSPTEFTNPAIGTEWDTFTDYIIIDGFKIYGAATLGHTKGSVIKNCEITGGGDSEFGNCIRVEEATDCIVRNNIVHDNVNSGGSNGSPLLMGFDSTNVIIEHNEFYNANTHGILYKDDPENIHIRYNIIRDNPHDGVWTANQDQGHNVYIYQNIFKNNGYNGADAGLEAGVKIAICVENVQIFNNLFLYNVDDVANMDGAGNGCTAPSWSSWNNIFSSPAHYHYSIKNPGQLSFLNYSDYNLYHDTLLWHYNGDINGLSNWQANSSLDQHSLTGDPLFNSTVDFHPKAGSPAINAGIDRQDHDNDGNSSESINIGPYITGNETIGVDVFATTNALAESNSSPTINDENEKDIKISGGCGSLGSKSTKTDTANYLLLLIAMTIVMSILIKKKTT